MTTALFAQDEQRITEVDGRTYEVRDHGMPPTVDAGASVHLLPVEGLMGWSRVGGNANIERDGDMIHGHGSAGRNTFLKSDRTYGDFILEGEIRINPGGNSGWQVRSHQPKPGDRSSGIRGYQIEVDSSERAWSGGFYDELRRGWIHPFKNDPDARKAFEGDEWNHYRIECIGPHVRTWVNGVACADVIDFMDLEGIIAFQVHSGRCDVRWRNLRITELGTSDFTPIESWRGLSSVDGMDGGFTRRPDGSIRGRSGSGSSMIRTALSGPDATVRMICRVRGGVWLHIGSPENEASFKVRLDEDRNRNGTIEKLRAVESAYPVVAEGAGTKPDEGVREVIIDIEGPRVVVIIDGAVTARMHAEEPITADLLAVEIEPGDNEIRILETRECTRSGPEMMNEAGSPGHGGR
jgi:hypothetical protein